MTSQKSMRSAPYKFLFLQVYSWIKENNRIFNLFLLTLSFLSLLSVYFYISPQVTGDEPHYLIADHALAHHHTFDLKATYTSEEYLNYYPGRHLLPQGDPELISLDKAHVYPMHGIGLSLFTLPGYILGGKNGVVIQMILLAVAVLSLTWLWCRRVTKRTSAAYLATISLSICYYFIGLSGYIYPDMTIAAILLSCLLLVTGPRYASTLSQVAIGLILSFGIFLHYRNIVIVLPVLLWLSYITWKRQRALPWVAIGITTVSVGLFIFSLYSWFGVLSPAAPYGNLTTISSQPFTNIVAMLFDSSRGIFVYNPILLLLAVGLPIWYKLSRQTLLITLLIAGPTMGMLAFFSQWTGGAAPTGRYIVAFLPVLIPSLAFAFNYLTSRWQRLIILILATTTLIVSSVAVGYKYTFIRYDTYKSTSGLVEQLRTYFGIDIEKVLPTFTNNTELMGLFGPLKVVFWIAVLVAITWYGYYLSKKIPDEKNGNKRKIQEVRNTI